jgi:hypothetical protein
MNFVNFFSFHLIYLIFIAPIFFLDFDLLNFPIFLIYLDFLLSIALNLPYSFLFLMIICLLGFFLLDSFLSDSIYYDFLICLFFFNSFLVKIELIQPSNFISLTIVSMFLFIISWKMYFFQPIHLFRSSAIK